MNQHLSSEQISKWLAGERTAQEELHLQECSQCAGELSRVEETFKMFRGSVVRLSEQERGSVPRMIRARRHVQPLRWAVAVAILSIALAVPFYRAANERHRQQMAKADAALLEQIDTEVSRAVPAPMEPLIDLVAWDSSNTRGGGKTR